MDLVELRAFLETVRLASFSDAARALGVTQPAVSRQVQRLEREVGASLLQRGDGPVAPTAAGHELLRFAERMLADYEATKHRIAMLQDRVSGDLRISASTIPGEFVVPRLVASFVARFPAATVSVSILDTVAVFDRLSANETDFGFVGDRLERPHLELCRVAEDEIVLGVFPEHPFAGRELVDLEDLAGRSFVLRESGSGTERSLRRLLAARGFTLPHHRVAGTFGSTTAVVTAIAAGLGIGFVSAAAIEGRRAEVSPVRIRGLPLRRDLYAVFVRDRLTTRLLREFAHFVESWNEQGASASTDRPTRGPDPSVSDG